MTSISPADFTVASTICATVSEELLYIALPPVNFIPETSTCTFVISVFDLDSALTATLPFALSTVPFDILAFVLEAKSTSLIPTLPVPIPAVTVTLVSSRASAPIPFIWLLAFTFILLFVFKLPLILEIEPVSISSGEGSGVVT